MPRMRCLVAALAALVLAVPAAAEERNPGKVRISPPAPPIGSEASFARKAAQWVDAPRAASVDPSKRPINYGGLLIAYHNGEPVEVCAGQFVSIRLILTTAGCVTDSKGNQWSGPFELYQGYDRRGYDRLYYGRCAAVFETWKGEAADDYMYDYALIYSSKTTRTGRYVVKTPPFRGPLKLYDIQKRRPVVYNGSLDGTGTSDGLKFVPVDPNDTAEMRGGAWIYKYSRKPNEKFNIVSSITSHVGADGTVYGPRFDRNYHIMFNAITGGCG